jgi:hypothetical protein
VSGAISSTVVTLSSSAEATAVTSTSRTITRSGSPWRAWPTKWRRTPTPRSAADANDDHHPEQQEDDIPVDAGVMGEERVL